MPKAKKEKPALTTAQQIGSLIKTARDLMRKDRGLSGDSDRLPQLTWIMFLKFLDDIESLRETEAELAGKKFSPSIEAPYRWRDWAADPSGISGEALIAFINQDSCTRPDNSTGPGLFKYLRGLQGTGEGDRRDVIANVFLGTSNRMISGYLLRDVINKVNGIHFNSSEELHLLGRTYETLLKEMRDAAGDAGEFYTPRAVVRFMVERTDPQLGETVLDPASGTGGFLVEAFSYLEKQAQTVKEREVLQRRSIKGGEAKPLPYLLTQMNLLLHGLENPQIDPGNALRFKVTEIGEIDRVDVLVTNPPFGGEEERGILGNFPDDRQTTETALLFLQLIMRRLRRKPTKPVKGEPRAARAAVVVPNGTLFADGIAARIKADLLKDFNLHTIVRLPQGVFAPYTDIPANLLFFERGGPTQDIWFYELPAPEGRKKYSKTAPLPYEAFADCTAWWTQRQEGPQAWRLDFAKALADAEAAAKPHYERAQAQSEQARALARQLEPLARESPEAVELKRQQQAAELASREAQRQGDTLYWAVFNLDLKNPIAAKAGVEATTAELMTRIRENQRQANVLLDEIAALVSAA